MTIAADDPRAVAATEAIHRGEVEALRRLLREHPELARERVAARDGSARTLLHVATDWPGHFPRIAATVAALVAAGADVGAPFRGTHRETPLHWAASSDDVAALDALVDAGADLEAPGAVIAGGTPLADAVAFGQWCAARRLVERGARTTLWQAAALGMTDRVESRLGTDPAPGQAELDDALWCACHGGSREAAALLLDRGAAIDRVGFDDLTPLDAARRSGAADVAAWLRERGARSAGER